MVREGADTTRDTGRHSDFFLLKLPRLVPTASPPRAAPCPPAPRTPKGPLDTPGEAAKSEGGWGRRYGADTALVEPGDRQAEPPEPPPQGISGAGAAYTTCGAPLRPGAALLSVWQRAPSHIFSPPLASWKTFCPLKSFAKGKIKKKKAENGEKSEQRASIPQLSLASPLRGEGRYLLLHFSPNLVNLSRVTIL